MINTVAESIPFQRKMTEKRKGCSQEQRPRFLSCTCRATCRDMSLRHDNVVTFLKTGLMSQGDGHDTHVARPEIRVAWARGKNHAHPSPLTHKNNQRPTERRPNHPMAVATTSQVSINGGHQHPQKSLLSRRQRRLR